MNTISNTLYKLIEFTGDYSQLKDNGFVFQKLYAANYMQWHHDEADIRIWRKGNDLSIESIGGQEGQLLQMMIDEVPFECFSSTLNPTKVCRSIRLYKNLKTNELSTDETHYRAEKMLDEQILADLQLNSKSTYNHNSKPMYKSPPPTAPNMLGMIFAITMGVVACAVGVIAGMLVI